jgi:hypothetical protein
MQISLMAATKMLPEQGKNNLHFCWLFVDTGIDFLAKNVGSYQHFLQTLNAITQKPYISKHFANSGMTFGFFR